MPETYLAHHGIKGQKWGVRNYQNPDGSLTALGRARRGYGNKKANKAAERAKAKAEKKAASKASRHENLKKYVRNHPASIYRHRSEFSSDEINKLVDEIRTDRKLKDIRNEEIQRGWDTVKQISNNLGTVKNLAENAKGVYNLAVEVQNTMIDSGKMSGPKKLKIGEKPEEKKDTSVIDAIVKSGDPKKIRDAIPSMTSKDLETAMKNMKYMDQLDAAIKKVADSSTPPPAVKKVMENPVPSAKEVEKVVETAAKKYPGISNLLPSGTYTMKDAYKPKH